MKTLMNKTLMLLALAGLLWGVQSCKKDIDAPPVTKPPVGEKVTVAQLLAQATSTPVAFTENKSLFGLITMGEANGNLYKEAYFQDVTGAVKLSFLSTTGLNVGDSVMVSLKKARLFNDNDQLSIDSLDVVNNLYKISAGNAVPINEVSIEDVNTGAYIGKLVKLSNVEFKDAELGKTWADAATHATKNRELQDCSGNSIIVRTSGYANFAGNMLPNLNGSMIAIASSYRGTAQLYVRDTKEVVFTNPRCDGGTGGGGEVISPVVGVDESFATVTTGADIVLEGWRNMIVKGSRKWQGKVYTPQSGGAPSEYAQATAYKMNDAEMETWMITPPVSDITNKKLSFKTAKAFWSHSTLTPLAVFISTDYDGSNFESATWTELTGLNLANESSSNNAWIESGDIDLSAYSGNAAIAFKYVGSKTETTSIRIDDVKIGDGTGGGGGGGGTINPVESVEQDFSTVENNANIALEGWTSKIVQGSREWQGKVYQTDKYAQATAYKINDEAMETWLITPPVSNISGKKLSFKTAKAFWKHTSSQPFSVYISTDFDGSNFETATWTELTGLTVAEESTADHAWVESGDIDLSAYSGNAAIAFKYVGSKTESTSYRIDDVKIGDGTGGGGGGGGGTINPVESIDQDFSSVTNNKDIAFDGWTNQVVKGTRKWIGKVYQTDKYGQASAYKMTDTEMETWLITPPVTNIATKKLSFKTAKAYWKHSTLVPFTVYISTDFDGSNFETATWTELTGLTVAEESTADHAWVESGDIDLSAYSGNAAIAFKYVGSKTETTSYRIDDLKVQ